MNDILNDWVVSKDIVVIKSAVESGVDINTLDSFGNSALMNNCMRGNIDTVKYLVEHGADVNLFSLGGYTALFWSRLHPLITAYLLEHGADVNLVSNDQLNLLSYAICTRNLDLLKLLFNFGADINMLVGTNNVSLLEFAKLNHAEEDILEFLTQKQKDYKGDLE